MNILHGQWCAGENSRLHVWIESSSLTSHRPHTKQGKLPEKNIPHHPLAADRAVLPEFLKDIDQKIIRSGRHDSLNLRLPTVAGCPVLSPGQDTKQEKALSFALWQVDTISFSPAQAFELLNQLSEPSGDSLHFGDTVVFLQKMQRLIPELIHSQSWMPFIESSGPKGGEDYFARWIIHPGLAQQLADILSPSMPALLSQERDRGEIIRDFLNYCLDCELRNIKVSELKESIAAENVPGYSAWLEALTAAVNRIDAPPRDILLLKEESDKLYGYEQAKPYRLCFKLIEPSSRQGLWCLQFLMQNISDTAQIFSLKQAWRGEGRAGLILKQEFPDYEKYLLKKLGEAAAYVLPLSEALKDEFPVKVDLTTEEAYRFLCEQAMLLQANGFGVFLPDWWHSKKKRLTMRLEVKSQNNNAGKMGLGALLDYDWKAMVGERTIDLNELEKLIHLKLPLVRLHGQWVEIRLRELENAEHFFQKRKADSKRNAQSKMSIGQLLRMYASQDISEVGFAIRDIKSSGWVKSLIDHLKNSDELSLITIPETFQGDLRSYQLRGVSWLAYLHQWRFGACLADDMGLGKTIQIIAFLLHLKANRDAKSGEPYLLICPMSVIGNWQRELRRFGPSLRINVHHGPQRANGKAFSDACASHDLTITTYSLALRDESLLSGCQWSGVILDEAQNIKNDAAGQTQAIKNIPADMRIALTGTPIENRLQDLWSLMDFLNPAYLGSAEWFRKNYIKPIEEKGASGKAASLQSIVTPFLLRRLKTDKTIIADLPEKMEMNTYCLMSEEQLALYEATLQNMFEQIREASGMQRRGLVLKTLLQLKQICDHPKVFLKDDELNAKRSGKTMRLLEMLEEALSEGDKAIVFTQFVEMGHLLQNELKEGLATDVLFMHGAHSAGERESMIASFQEDPEKRIFVLSTKAGGTGINLTAANHVFHYDRWWNPATEDQATDRAYRIGQTKNVQVHKFIAMGTLEEKIDQMIERKRELAESVIVTGEDFLTELGDDELHALLKLDREAGMYVES